MPGQKHAVILLRGPVQPACDFLLRINPLLNRIFVKAVVASDCRVENDHFVRSRYRQSTIFRNHLTARGLHRKAGLEEHSPSVIKNLRRLRQTMAPAIPELGIFPGIAPLFHPLQCAAQHQPRRLAPNVHLRPFRADFHGMRRGQPQAHIQPPRPVRSVAQNDYLVRVAGEYLPREQDTAALVPHPANALAEIEFPPVARDRALFWRLDVQVSQRLIAGPASPQPAGFHELSRRGELPLGDRLRDRGEVLLRIERQIAIPRAARDERRFIQLQPLPAGATENHRSQASIAHRERLIPSARRIFIPERLAGRNGGDIHSPR